MLWRRLFGNSVAKIHPCKETLVLSLSYPCDVEWSFHPFAPWTGPWHHWRVQTLSHSCPSRLCEHLLWISVVLGTKKYRLDFWLSSFYNCNTCEYCWSFSNSCKMPFADIAWKLKAKVSIWYRYILFLSILQLKWYLVLSVNCI